MEEYFCEATSHDVLLIKGTGKWVPRFLFGLGGIEVHLEQIETPTK
jgi:hypothetical protein